MTGESDRAALASGNPVPVAHLQVTMPAPPSQLFCLSQLSAGMLLQNIFPGCNGRGMCTKVRSDRAYCHFAILFSALIGIRHSTGMG